MIEVVSAVIVDDGRILLTQRMPPRDFPWMWECPGGKVDSIESHHDAIRRELLEELDVEVRNIAEYSLAQKQFTHNDNEYFVLLYHTILADGAVPKPLENQGIGWFSIAEVFGLELTPGNRSAIVQIHDKMMRSIPAVKL